MRSIDQNSKCASVQIMISGGSATVVELNKDYFVLGIVMHGTGNGSYCYEQYTNSSCPGAISEHYYKEFLCLEIVLFPFHTIIGPPHHGETDQQDHAVPLSCMTSFSPLQINCRYIARSIPKKAFPFHKTNQYAISILIIQHACL